MSTPEQPQSSGEGRMDHKITGNTDAFFSDVAGLLHAARRKAYQAVNSIMVETYWNIGRRIVEQEQQGKGRAGYGEYLITGLSRHLAATFGKGFSEANIKNMRQFYVIFPDFRQFATCQIPGDHKVYDERDPTCQRATVSWLVRVSCRPELIEGTDGCRA